MVHVYDEVCLMRYLRSIGDGVGYFWSFFFSSFFFLLYDSPRSILPLEVDQRRVMRFIFCSLFFFFFC